MTGRVRLHGVAVHRHSPSDQLYSVGHSYVDLSVDEHGLWAIYAVAASTSSVNEGDGGRKVESTILISRIGVAEDIGKDDAPLTIDRTWSIAVPHSQFGNGYAFVFCFQRNDQLIG